MLDWRSVRPEGRDWSYFAPRIPAYVAKALVKKWSASPEHIAHFDEQRRVLARLSREKPSPYSDDSSCEAKLSITGDFLWVPFEDSRSVSDGVRRLLASQDLVLGNLETPLSSKHPIPTRGRGHLRMNTDPRHLERFRSDDGSRSLFSGFALANNHVFDAGDLALSETLANLDRAGISATGVSREPEEPGYALFERNGIRFGFCAFTYGVNPSGCPGGSFRVNQWPELLEGDLEASAFFLSLKNTLRRMSQDRVDFKIVSAHWGHEFELYPTPRQRRAARLIVEAGADLIMGHHSHVPQPSEVMLVRGADGRPERKAFVAYSLGNFFTNMFTFSCEIGLIESIVVTKDDNGRVDWHTPRYAFLHNSRALRLMKEYTAHLGARPSELDRLEAHLGDWRHV